MVNSSLTRFHYLLKCLLLNPHLKSIKYWKSESYTKALKVSHFNLKTQTFFKFSLKGDSSIYTFCKTCSIYYFNALVEILNTSTCTFHLLFNYRKTFQNEFSYNYQNNTNVLIFVTQLVYWIERGCLSLLTFPVTIDKIDAQFFLSLKIISTIK